MINPLFSNHDLSPEMSSNPKLKDQKKDLIKNEEAKS